MIRTLTFFLRSGFKEISLPSINNDDYLLKVESKMYPEINGLSLGFEVINDAWYILDAGKYPYSINKKPATRQALKAADIIHIKKSEKDYIVVMFQESAEAFRDLTKVFIGDRKMISIGRDPICNIVLDDNQSWVSQHHSLLHFKDNAWYIKDSSTNGTFVNGHKISKEEPLQSGDIISIVGIRIMFLGKFIALDTRSGNYTVKLNELKKLSGSNFQGELKNILKKNTALFHRAPRTVFPIKKKVFDIDNPPEKEAESTASLLFILGPSMTMIVPMMAGSAMSSIANNSAMAYVGVVTALLSASFAVLWGTLNYKRANKLREEKERKRIKAYSEYLNEKGTEIEEDYNQRRASLGRMYMEVSAYLGDVDEGQLWTRNQNHKDFMYYRLGIGNIPSLAEINVRRQGFRVEKDPWQGKGEEIKKTFKELKEVPVGIDLMNQSIIGVVSGGNREGAVDILRLLAVQIAYNNCYTDVKLAAIYDEKKELEANSLEPLKWFPHCWSTDKKTRYIAGSKDEAREVFFDLSQCLRDRFNSEKDNLSYSTHYVLMLTDKEYLEGELIKSFVDSKKNVGLHTIIIADSVTDLPNEVDFVIQNEGYFKGFYSLLADYEDRVAIKFDYISDKNLDVAARKLATYKVKENTQFAGLPAGIDFIKMYGVNSLSEIGVYSRWIKNRSYESMRSLVGVKDGGKPCFLDIHEKYHGPHGLIAGTTGSGKSETLQTYLLSLAINFSPDDVAYFIIDYKGGGMANLFDGLPHMVGAISNLSGNQIQRALASIKSENRRRQRMLNEAGVNNINNYTRLYKDGSITEPMPHLLIIVDEFAELKREEPEFMKQLISVAQVGRSLGVHLILSTQKPAGTVDDNIWSNSKFRLCLRVQDVQDSKDMLKKPDAAYLTNPGRCYMQVGQDEVYELFQSGYSGAVYQEQDQSQNQKIANMLDLNGKVSLVGNANQRKLAKEKKEAWILKIIELMIEYINNNANYSSKTEAEIIEKLESILKKNSINIEKNERNERKLYDLFGFVAENDNLNKEGILKVYISRLESSGEDLPTELQKTQLDAVIEYLAMIFEENNYKPVKPLWLEPLAERIEWRKLKVTGSEKSLNEGGLSTVAIGVVDHPHNQEQFVLEYNLESMGNTLIIGLPGSGKSTFLQTLLYALMTSNTPDKLWVYGIDYSSRITGCFESFPNCGGIVFENEDEKLERLIHLIKRILDERKALIKGQSFADYNRRAASKLPVIVLYIDQYSSFRNQVRDEIEDFLIKLSGEGVAYGIYLIFTAASLSAGDISSKLSKNFMQVYPLEMKDKFDYAEAISLMRIETLPEQGVKGRGLVRVDDFALECQIAVVDEKLSDYDRSENMLNLGKELTRRFEGIKVIPIPTIPQNASYEDFCENIQVKEAIADNRLLPFAYNMKNALPHSIALDRSLGYLISGKHGAGKTNALKIIYRMAADKGGKVYYIDMTGNVLHLPEYENAKVVRDYEELNKMCEEIIPPLKSRNQRKKKMEEDDYAPEEIFLEFSKEQPIFILIDELPTFLDKLQKAADKYAIVKNILENFAEKGRLHKLYFIMTLDNAQAAQVGGYTFFQLLKNQIEGIQLGGNCIGQTILSFDKLNYKKQNQSLKPGYAFVSSTDEDAAEEVYVPVLKSKKSKEKELRS